MRWKGILGEPDSARGGGKDMDGNSIKRGATPSPLAGEGRGEGVSQQRLNLRRIHSERNAATADSRNAAMTLGMADRCGRFLCVLVALSACDNRSLDNRIYDFCTMIEASLTCSQSNSDACAQQRLEEAARELGGMKAKTWPDEASWPRLSQKLEAILADTKTFASGATTINPTEEIVRRCREAWEMY